MNIINVLKDPNLVVKFQNICGVYSLKQNRSSNDTGLSAREDLTKSIINKEFDSKCHSSESYKDDLPKENKANKESTWTSQLFCDGNVGSEGLAPQNGSPQTKSSAADFTIKNWFIYYIFYLATKTGDEIFYIVFFPFWNWNIDGAVMREVIYIWMITMYIGQAMKDILKVPRPPSPPVIRLDPKWGLEYGLPSTHAMVGFSIPFSTFILSLNRYQLNWFLCCAIALTWCVLVSSSRIYLGMHSVLDIVSGLILVGGLLCVILPVIEAWDHFMLIHPLSPLISITLSIAMVICYPTTDRWTPARGDTTVIVGVGCGCLVGYWLNYQLGIISETSLKPPFTILWPSLGMVAVSFLRTFLGLAFLVVIRTLVKPVSVKCICALLQISSDSYKKDPSRIQRKHRLIVELFYKFVTYFSIGFNIVFLCPILFKAIGVERPTFYTEI